jgi:hypothetical protein
LTPCGILSRCNTDNSVNRKAWSIPMQTLPIASPEEQAIVIKAAEDRYRELGVPVETAAILFQDELVKAAQAMMGQMEKDGQYVQPLVQGVSRAGGTLQDFWSALPPMVRQGLINALVGGGIGAAGGAGYGLLQGQAPGPLAAQGAGFGALAGGVTPILSQLIEKFSEDLDASFEVLTKSALDQLTEAGFPNDDAEQILLMQLNKIAVSLGAFTSKMDDKKPVPIPKPPADAKAPQAKKAPMPKTMPHTGKEKVVPKTMPIKKESCDADKGDYHANTVGAYPMQVFADVKKKVNKTQKQRKIKKIAAHLSEAVKEAKCDTPHGKPAAQAKPKTKKKEVKK